MRADGNLEYETRDLPFCVRCRLALRILVGRMIRLRFREINITEAEVDEEASES